MTLGHIDIDKEKIRVCGKDFISLCVYPFQSTSNNIYENVHMALLALFMVGSLAKFKNSFKDFQRKWKIRVVNYFQKSLVFK